MSDPPAEPIKGHCPNCGPSRLSDVVGHHHTEETDHDVWGRSDYRILQCRGCEAVYFQTDSVCSEDWDYGDFDPQNGAPEIVANHSIVYWPAPSKRPSPDWVHELDFIDRELCDTVSEIYVALNNNLRVLSAIGIRTAFDRASRLLGVDPKKNFAKKLCALLKLGKIGSDEKETLAILTDGGNAAAHRGWKPEPEQLATMMNVIEAFLFRTFILEAHARKLKDDIPKRQKDAVVNPLASVGRKSGSAFRRSVRPDILLSCRNRVPGGTFFFTVNLLYSEPA